MSAIAQTAGPAVKKLDEAADWGLSYRFADHTRKAYWESQKPPQEGHPDWAARLASFLATAQRSADEAFLLAAVLPEGREADHHYRVGIFMQGIVTHGGR